MGVVDLMKLFTCLVFIVGAPLHASSLAGDSSFSQKFFRRLVQWRDSLIEDDPRLGQVDIRPEETVPGWAPSNRITWNPLSCRQAGIEFTRGRLVFGNPRAKIPENAVWQVADKRTGQMYAYKAFGNSHDYAAEIAFYMQAGQHPSLVKPICVQRPDDQKGKLQGGLLMEWFDGIDSLDYVQKSHLSHSDIVKLSKSVMEGLIHIHQLGFVHADLKSGNVLVSPHSKTVKIIDFGFASPVNHVQHFRGNARIIPPEMAGLGTGRPGFGIDWWAFGSLVAGWHATRYPTLLSHCQHGKYSPLILEKNAEFYDFCPAPVNFPPDIRQVLYVCLNPVPSMRSFFKAENIAILRNLPYFITAIRI